MQVMTLFLILSSEFQLSFYFWIFFSSWKKDYHMFWANPLFTMWLKMNLNFSSSCLHSPSERSKWMLLCPVCVCIFNEHIIPHSQRMFILVCFACWFLYWVIPQHSPWLNELFMLPFWVYALPLCEYFLDWKSLQNAL